MYLHRRYPAICRGRRTAWDAGSRVHQLSRACAYAKKGRSTDTVSGGVSLERTRLASPNLVLTLVLPSFQHPPTTDIGRRVRTCGDRNMLTFRHLAPLTRGVRTYRSGSDGESSSSGPTPPSTSS